MPLHTALESIQARLEDIAGLFVLSPGDRERLALLDATECVQETLAKHPWHDLLLPHLSLQEELLLKELIAIDEWPRLIGALPQESSLDSIRAFLADLAPVEAFYKDCGGLVGYHLLMLSLLNTSEPTKEGDRTYYAPQGIDISESAPRVASYVEEGIRSLPQIAEMYPVGGAADRLKLSDPVTGEPLPAARLPFLGRTLLEGLIRDVQGREWLYFKLFGQQIAIPVALMTSAEKNNHQHIETLCEEAGWFGRGREQFHLFSQPLVPTMDLEGKWCLAAPLKLLMKPGGHGVIWKLAQESGLFKNFRTLGKTKLLVRQINNPLAGIDQGLLAFTGVGCARSKRFGFASCQRQVGAAEGVNVLLEKKTAAGSFYSLTSVEYCDFSKSGIEDAPICPHSPYARFPSNTNILFADLDAVEQVLPLHPVPGMLVNAKTLSFVDPDGTPREEPVVRLESTMQNIADAFEATSPSDLDAFLTYNRRCKTISTTKRLWQAGSSLLETPEGALYDLLLNAEELLSEHCSVQVPPLPPPDLYLEQGPPFLFTYHPALGPNFSIIAQKFRGGRLFSGSDLLLDIAEIAITDLELDGALHIIATSPLGSTGSKGTYSDGAAGKCLLRHVRFENEGIDFSASNSYCQRALSYTEKCEIWIEGDGEFVAENVTFRGDLRIRVPSGERVIATEEAGQIVLRREPSRKQPLWSYAFEPAGAIRLMPL
jgi:hypothetical protein